MRLKCRLFYVILLGSFLALAPGVARSFTIRISSTQAAPGTQGVEVTIDASRGEGVAGGDLTLTYDQAALDATEVEIGELADAAALTLVSNTNLIDRVNISLAGVTALTSEPGTLFTIRFNVRPDARPGVYPLDLSQAVFRDAEARVVTPDTIGVGVFAVAENGVPSLPPSGIDVSIGKISGAPGDHGVPVDIFVQHAADIIGGDLTVSYDGTVMTATEVRAGSLAQSAGMILVSNTNLAGKVNVSVAGTTALAAESGVLCTILFDIAGSADVAQSAISLSRATFRDAAATLLPVTNKMGGSISLQASQAKTPDFNGDGEVGFPDFLIFAQAFGAKSGDPRFLDKADLNSDGEVGFPDFLIFAQAFGRRVG